MNPSEAFRQQVLKQLSGTVIIPEKDLDSILEKPPEGLGADLALPCFLLASKLKKDPGLISLEIVTAINKSKKPGINKSAANLVGNVRAVGPYVNFYANWDKMASLVLNDIQKKKNSYGKLKKAKPEKVMTEYCHANTHKAFHIGHVRNICLGESISRIIEHAGSKVVRTNYQGDIGPHVAKCLWGFINLHKKRPPKGIEKGLWLGDVYADATFKVKGNDELGIEVQDINTKLYAKDKDLSKIWKQTRKWSLDYYNKIYKDFGARFNRCYFESEVEKPGKRIVLDMHGKGIAKKSQGAIVMDYELDGLGVFVLLTQDGNPLYGAKDLGLAKLQDKEYKPDRILHIVGTEQNMYFRQLFKTIGLIDRQIAKKEFHICYELVNLPSGKMSSRTGSVITYDELKTKMTELAKKVTAEKNPKLKGTQLEKTADIVALGALKYGMLMVSPEKTITFDWNRALSFEGNSAPYIQYSHARASSIISKARIKTIDKPVKEAILTEDAELNLIKHLAAFPDAVSNAARDLRPHYIAHYAYDLAVKFNEFYEKLPVINAPTKETRRTRLALVRSTKIVLRNGLHLLGIKAPEEM